MRRIEGIEREDEREGLETRFHRRERKFGTRQREIFIFLIRSWLLHDRCFAVFFSGTLRLTPRTVLHMDSETNEHQIKQERLRTRWTAALDKIFTDLIVEQIQLGNRPNDVFDKKSWGQIRDEFNRRTALNFNNNQLRKHLDVLRTCYNNLKSALDQNEFAVDDTCCMGFDLWEGIGAHAQPKPVKIKDSPIYEQLCTIFSDNEVVGKYAQSSHYEDIENKATEGEAPAPSRSIEGYAASAENAATRSTAETKRKCTPDARAIELGRKNQEITEAMVEAMLDMVAASRRRTVGARSKDKSFSIASCINALDAIEGVEQSLYFAALDLFENPSLREAFISLDSNDNRLQWLHGKCSSAVIFEVLACMPKLKGRVFCSL
ncbi:hypothetical protein Nepgr_018347 [Nepenthes gracilis]|uniref:Myb/SANT-like domain-containing protein n=1 Tax=Nepenthes gracilis TaxID=150966 RepID=A0AAD3SUP9_NEPGR|nr:hypothetical protein Nepgr_018347 [Nepenthes gracilis]